MENENVVPETQEGVVTPEGSELLTEEEKALRQAQGEKQVEVAGAEAPASETEVPQA